MYNCIMLSERVFHYISRGADYVADATTPSEERKREILKQIINELNESGLDELYVYILSSDILDKDS